MDCSIDGILYSGEISNEDFRIKKNGRIVCYGRVTEAGNLIKHFTTIHHLVLIKDIDYVIETLKKAMFQDYGTLRGWE